MGPREHSSLMHGRGFLAGFHRQDTLFYTSQCLVFSDEKVKIKVLSGEASIDPVVLKSRELCPGTTVRSTWIIYCVCRFLW